MLQQDKPDDYVVGTGETHSVRGVRRDRLRPRRPRLAASTSSSIRSSTARPRSICCWPTPARRSSVLGWEPEVSFEELVRMMVDADLAQLRTQQTLANYNFAKARVA